PNRATRPAPVLAMAHSLTAEAPSFHLTLRGPPTRFVLTRERIEMIESLLLAALMVAADSTVAPVDTTQAPSSRRIVRRLEEVVVRASPLHDMLSSETVHLVSREDLRTLPIDGLADAIALKAGVVALGEELHVRGGRTGETQFLLRGMPLNDAQRGRPMDLPLLAVESVELVSGGLDPEFGGALAGVIQVRTPDVDKRWSGESRWETDGGLNGDYSRATQYDRVSARAGGPLGFGVGTVVAADVLTD